MDYYASRDLLRTQEDPEVAQYVRYRANSGGDDELNVEPDDDTFESDDEYEQDVIDSENVGDYDTLDPPTHPAQNIDMLNKSNPATNLAAISTTTSTASTSISATGFSMSVDDVEKYMRDLKKYTSSDLPSANTISRHLSDDFPVLETRVQLLERAIEKSANRAPRSTEYQDIIQQSTQVTMPSLENVVVAYSLNRKQETMFVRMGHNLLQSLILPEQPAQQEIAFLGGHPGAGKSRVIAALQALAIKWDMPQAVATAYQGVAAQAANGQTIHKLFGWYVNSRRQWAPTSEQKDRFSRLKLLILDEVSTCDVSIIGKIDSSLRKLLDRPNAVFGGVHVLLVGDWLQQLPVAGQPAFMSADELLESRSRQQSNTSDYLDRLRGINAYKALTSVVILTENMRHQHDPVWRTILVKWRVGNYDQKDIDLVNDIAYSKNWTSSAASLESYCPIIVTSNALRVEFNSSTLRSFCQKSNVPLHRFPATVRRPRHPLTKFQRKSLGSIRDDKISGMPINLEIALGSTVQCTKNVSTTFKLANGSIGTVVAITPSQDDVVQVRIANGIEEHYHSLPPDVVFVKLKDYASQSFVSTLPLDVVPVCKRTECGVRIRLPDRSFSISICQVSLVLAYSLTTEKCQGLTVEKMILAPLRHPTRRIPQRSSFYVAVTRVKTLSQLYLMAPLTKEFLEYFTPSRDALAETQRLHAIEDRTD